VSRRTLITSRLAAPAAQALGWRATACGPRWRRRRCPDTVLVEAFAGKEERGGRGPATLPTWRLW